jgi:TPP-dependent pyruvate/acetoin dehydrogenase alpha subunit
MTIGPTIVSDPSAKSNMLTDFSPDQLLASHRSMILIRRFEETVNELYMQGKGRFVKCPVFDLLLQIRIYP